MNEDLIAFAEEVRRACLDIAGAAGAGKADLAGERALALCTRAAVVKQGQLMKAESAGSIENSDKYSLAGLKVNLGAEAPERIEEI